jgi:hypothetical protein
MPIEECLKFEGAYYGVGTKLKFCPYVNSLPMIGVIERFVHHWMYIRGENGQLYQFSTMPYSKYHINPIVGIIEPVYCEMTLQAIDNRVLPSEGDIDIGWIWYIAIMLLATIFKDRLTIWFIATAIFFLWKNGFLNGGNE